MGADKIVVLKDANLSPTYCPGITEKLQHFVDLNIKAVWISPFYKSPMMDFGYDVEDFRSVDPLFGTMQDFDDLLTKMHDMGESKATVDYKEGITLPFKVVM